jgi:hypothetical protein
MNSRCDITPPKRPSSPRMTSPSARPTRRSMAFSPPPAPTHRSSARRFSASWSSSTWMGPFYTAQRRAARSARPNCPWRLLLRPIHLRPYMGAFRPRRDEEAAGHDGGVERSGALDREHGRRVIARRKAAAMRTIVCALHLLLPSHADTPKSQYLFMPSCPPSLLNDTRRARSSTSTTANAAR